MKYKKSQMKIGIFGDSNADCYHGGTPDHQHLSWPNLLEKRFSVSNYALAGSGLEYSLDNLFRHEHEYDKIIFVSTVPDRLAINERHHHKLAQPRHIDAELHQHIRPANIEGRPGDRYYNKALKLAQRHYDTFVNYEHLDLRVALIWKSLYDYFGDRLLLLYTHSPSLNYIEQFNLPQDNMNLFNISHYENTYLFGNETPSWQYDKRSCHITHWHHAVLFDKIIKWISTGFFSLTENDLVKLDKQEVRDMYYGKY